MKSRSSRRARFSERRSARISCKGVLTTDVEFGNDGALYVLDWVESWGGVGKGRIYKFVTDPADTTLQAETQKLIAEGMNHRARWRAGEAARARRPARAAGRAIRARCQRRRRRVCQSAADPQPGLLARLHAIWGLGQLGEKAIGPLVPLLRRSR